MDAKLKALKVVDLKDVLAKANVSVPSKANKQDLIARVLASPAALEVYNAQHSPSKPSNPAKGGTLPIIVDSTSVQSDDLLAPPEDVDWNLDDVPSQEPPATQTTESTQKTESTPARPNLSEYASEAVPTVASLSPAKQAIVAEPKFATTAAPSSDSTSQSAETKSSEDVELEKRRARAARFEVPLVEPPKAKAKADTKPAKAAATASGPAKSFKNTPSDDPEKLAARAKRFGLVQQQQQQQQQLKQQGTAAPAEQNGRRTNGRKRTAPPVEIVDAEEMERRRKRAERFGMPVMGSTKV